MFRSHSQMLTFPLRMCDITGLNLLIYKLYLGTYFQLPTFSSSYIICQMRSSLLQQLSESSCVWENALCHFAWALRCHKRGIATALGTHSQKAGNTFLAMMGSYEDNLWQGAASRAYTGYMQTAGNEAHYWGHTSAEDGPKREVDKLRHVEIEVRWGERCTACDVFRHGAWFQLEENWVISENACCSVDRCQWHKSLTI